jgi:hypothetical protein
VNAGIGRNEGLERSLLAERPGLGTPRREGRDCARHGERGA